MPFDSLTLVTSPRDLLSAAASTSGLKPIAPETLEAHKAAEIRAHPPGWLYRHRNLVLLGQGLVLLSGIIAFFAFSSVDRYGLAFAACCAALVIAFAVMSLPIEAPAQWRERPLRDLSDVHPAVREAALRLQGYLPDAQFRIGELFQDRVRLDPYLIAVHGEARIVLGIWEGDRLIASA
jgi:hypothetical protein